MSLTKKQSAELIRQVADGLAHLHSHEILHQDIKPDNILIGKGDTYLLMDFGISMRMRSTLRKQTGYGEGHDRGVCAARAVCGQAAAGSGG